MTLESSFELIRRAQGGDEEALNGLVGRYVPRLLRWASGRLPAYARDLADTNDMVQDAVIRTFRDFARFEDRGEGALHALLRRVVMNRIVDEIRRVERRPLLDELDTAIPDRGMSPLESAIGAQAIDRYERALAILTDTEQQAVVARIELGYTYEEVALLVGKPTAGAARVAISRALAKLARQMSSDGQA